MMRLAPVRAYRKVQTFFDFIERQFVARFRGCDFLPIEAVFAPRIAGGRWKQNQIRWSCRKIGAEKMQPIGESGSFHELLFLFQ